MTSPEPIPSSTVHSADGELANDGGIFRLLIEGISDYAIYLLSPSGMVSSWNPGAERFKGYQAHEIVGKHFSTFYTPEDVSSGLPEFALRQAQAVGKFENEGWRVRKDGTRFWAYVVIDRILTPSGELAGFAKITRDLTERRMAEEALRHSHRQFQLLVDGVTDYAIYMLAPDGTVTTWNTGAQRIKGYSPEQAIGGHFSRFYTQEDREAGEPMRALNEARRTGRSEKEGWRVKKDGSRFWANVVIDAVMDDSGELLGFAKITRDITQQREARSALEHTREALYQAQKMESIGRLTGGVAHDFNNLLTAIIGSLEMLQKRLHGDYKARSLLGNALEGARRGSVLTQRMLAFARRQELSLEALDLVSLITGVSELLNSSVGPTIRIELHLPLKLPGVLADGTQLELALLNLVVNARDAMPEGGAVTLSAKQVSVAAQEVKSLAAGDYVALSVTDTGRGMDSATLARAAEPFFTTKGAGIGTGLGLSMVQGLMQQCGGALRLTSTQGVGTTAELLLPVTHDLPVERPRRIAAQPARSLGSMTVLVVDDDLLVLDNTVAMLEELGHKVLSASSAVAALEIVQSNAGIDLLLTDQMMPGMTGSQLIAQVRDSFPELPVILATGYAELEKGGEIAGTRLAKPFDMNALATAVNAALLAARQ